MSVSVHTNNIDLVFTYTNGLCLVSTAIGTDVIQRVYINTPYETIVKDFCSYVK